jgi:hypothetical protein
VWKAIKSKKPFLLCVLAFFLMGVDSNDQGLAERAALGELEQTLQARVEKLYEEQDALLFQKEMYDVDSKYLMLDMTRKTGQLRYKNRVLTEFRFIPSKRFPAASLKAGALVLTKKTDGKKDVTSLEFGKALVILWRRTSVSTRKMKVPFLSLPKNEMRSIFMAVEQGAMVYIVK